MSLTRRSLFRWAIGVAAGTVLAKMPLAGASVAEDPLHWKSFIYPYTTISRDDLIKKMRRAYKQTWFVSHKFIYEWDYETGELVEKEYAV